MTDRPKIICLMTSSLDGRLHPSRWTRSPDGSIKDWSASYEAHHDALKADAWLVGRATMAEMAKGAPHPPAEARTPSRPIHIGERMGPFAIAIDRHGKLHFARPDVGGDSVVVLLGPGVSDAHLAELAGDGISYMIADDEEMALMPLMKRLEHEFGIKTLLLEGGGVVNGAFFAAGLVDEFVMFLAPALDGSPSSAIVEAGDESLLGKVTLSLIACDPLDHGLVRLRYAVAVDQA